MDLHVQVEQSRVEVIRDPMTASEIHGKLDQLRAERAEACETGLAEVRLYMADLEREIAECRSAYVAAALTEISSLRGQLLGRQFG